MDQGLDTGDSELQLPTYLAIKGILQIKTANCNAEYIGAPRMI